MTDQRDTRETVVVKDGGSGAGLILGVIVLIVVLAGGWYFLMGPGAGSTSVPDDINVNVEVPTIEPAAS
jgi:hypothetical protein